MYTHSLPTLGASGDIWEKHHFQDCCSLLRFQSKLEKCTVLRDITRVLHAFLQLYSAKVSLHYVLLTLLGIFQENNTKTKIVINYGLEWINTFCFTAMYTVTQFYYVILKTPQEQIVPPQKAETEIQKQMIFPILRKIPSLDLYIYIHTHTLVCISINNKDLCPCGGVE